MGGWTATVGAVTAVYAIAGLGALLRRRGRLGPEADRGLMDLTVGVLMPCLILRTLLGNERLADPRNLVWPPLLGSLTLLLGFAAGAAFVRLLRPLPGIHTEAQRRTFVLATGLYNSAYVPIPLTRLLFDSSTLGVLFVYNVGFEVTMWTAGVLVVGGGLGAGWWRKVLNPPLLAVLAALALNAAGAAPLVPAFVKTILQMLGDCAIPVALLTVGATAADHLHPGTWARGRRLTAAACLLRLGLLPAAFVAAAAWLPLSLELRRVLALQAAMPSAMFTIVLARYFGGHPLTAVRVVLATSLVSLLTIPLWLALGLALVG